jgi:hypothetical protein
LYNAHCTCRNLGFAKLRRLFACTFFRGYNACICTARCMQVDLGHEHVLSLCCACIYTFPSTMHISLHQATCAIRCATKHTARAQLKHNSHDCGVYVWGIEMGKTTHTATHRGQESKNRRNRHQDNRGDQPGNDRVLRDAMARYYVCVPTQHLPSALQLRNTEVEIFFSLDG